MENMNQKMDNAKRTTEDMEPSSSSTMDSFQRELLHNSLWRSIPGNGWLTSSCKGAALWSTETTPQDIRTSSEGFVRAKINGVTFYSCYAPPRWEISRYQRMLRSLVADARGRSPVVIGGDFNVWSPEWGSRAPNERGTSLLEHFAALDVVLANRGQKLTYSKAGRGSIIDITFVSSALIRRCNWEVSDAFTFSDHQAIHFTLGGQLRTACLRARRRFQRARGSENLTTRTEEFKAAKRALKLAIKASKRECFQKICDEAEVDPWGTAYKVVMKRLKGQEHLRPTCPTLLRKIVEALFPKHPPKRDTIPADDGEPFTPVTEEEIRNYAKRIKARKTQDQTECRIPS
ncbi:uncharacterized protein [Drosophila bipectinata]|uniref:uncharacterized protein n=1 Tax=Drosophila bipectinata TaxID=42026 RepID=UPI0038B35BC3